MACVQGLVGATLKDGDLTDPKGTKMFYFNETLAQQVGDGNTIAHFYKDLKFPFNKTTEGGITKYYYDSANGEHVYYDYPNKVMQTSSDRVICNYEQNKIAGFFPLNKPNDSDDAVNTGFGVKFSIQFTVTPGGKIKGTNGEELPITFDFTGDDDVWVFIDDYLVLDMGGAHCKATGSIDFAALSATVEYAYGVKENQSITYGNKSPNGNSYGNTFESGTYDGKGLTNYLYSNNTEERDTGDYAETSKGFPTDLANKFKSEYNNNKTNVHTLTMFYMERGMLESNMSISFTMTPIPSGVSVGKNFNDAEINDGLESIIGETDTFDFDFKAEYTGTDSIKFDKYALIENGVKTFYTPTITNSSTNSKQIYSTILQGLNKNIYAGSFFNSNNQNAFMAGTTFTITERATTHVFQYGTPTWKVYDFADTSSAKVTTSGNTVTFTMGAVGEQKSYNYIANCINNLLVGDLQVTKTADASLSATIEYKFQIKLDLDGGNGKFSSIVYEGLTYTAVDGDSNVRSAATDSNGYFTLKSGETATFKGIPQGATYEVTEVLDGNYMPSYTNNAGTIKSGINEVEVHNSVNSQTIYVEANGVNKNAKTEYTIKYGNDDEDITLDTVTIPDGYTGDENYLNITWTSGTGKITVTTDVPGKTFTVPYTGKLADGTKVTGTLIIHTYQATTKTYVFDFGLSSNLATNTKSGLFYGGTWTISGVGTTATYIGTEYDTATASYDSWQTSVSGGENVSIVNNVLSNGNVTFKPIDYMDRIEYYKYTVQIAPDPTKFDSSNPETGTTVTGYIKVMPANTVYYEDNFMKDEGYKIKFDNNQPTSSPTGTQSNDRFDNYGHDDAYISNTNYSSITATLLENGNTAVFTFKGKGFDIISKTDGSSGGMKVEVFVGDSLPDDKNVKAPYIYYVDTVYKNGTLYQVPVIDVDLSIYGTYTVRITSLNTYDGTGGVRIDAIRIYNPLEDSSSYIPSEQGVVFTELRDLYFGSNNLRDETFNDDNPDNDNFIPGSLSLIRQIVDAQGNISFTTVDANAVVENYTVGTNTPVAYGTTWADLYKSGPNNEMYLPIGHGIKFNVNVSSAANFTLQLGAKSVRNAGVVNVYVKVGNSYYDVDTIDMATYTDMYHDLTTGLINALKKAGSTTGTFELFVVNASDSYTGYFVSLTTVKHSNGALGQNG